MPYESHAFPQTAPGRLAAIAFLLGLDPIDVSTARVLEIGCAAGGNLIPFAAWHPDAKVVGIDLSPVQIEQGRRRVQALGLTNLELVAGRHRVHRSAAFGEFDFIICHGVYSWVPEHVQQAILSTFQSALSRPAVWHTSATTCIRAGKAKRSFATRCSCAGVIAQLPPRNWATRAA